jgi:hypothetical protein
MCFFSNPLATAAMCRLHFVEAFRFSPVFTNRDDCRTRTERLSTPLRFWFMSDRATVLDGAVRLLGLITAICGALLAQPASAQLFVSSTGDAADFALVGNERAALVWHDTADAKVVGLAARHLADDVARVTGVRPELVTTREALVAPAVLIGTLGGSRLIDELVGAGKLDASRVRGQWETFLIATVEDPFPGLSRALVIVGSDRRGTAFGVYELSQQIGVSPWYWWADVPPKQSASLYVRAGAVHMGPPSVKYRGIFLNDEDWGLHAWAARTYEPETGDIGPKTYARIFELLLRLKANTVWPAMHPTTKAFNLYPQNRVVADDYAIVMGSSHAEPMLRNNVTEWTAPARDFNYVDNADEVRGYWEQRVAENGKYENLYTLGMRGIHDSGMMGAQTTAEKLALLEKIFADQRALLAKHVDPDPSRVPQVFTPYKEVLSLYRAGLNVPDDVTIVWPDDNFGYIRSYPTPQERARSGGFGVYYHLSYLGAPLAYLWLYTTPPALVWEEMSKAYDHGARTLWIANVGDLKPAEIGTEFFLQMAWDIDRWRRDNLPDYLRDWATRQFGPEHAADIAEVMDEYYQLNYQRKPEHLQWWLPGQRVRSHPLTEEQVWSRLSAFRSLTKRVDQLEQLMPAGADEAFFQLVAYPVRGAALANQRYFYAEAYSRNIDKAPAIARSYARRARLADSLLVTETRHYNEGISDGKWRHMMALEPADNLWRGFRISPAVVPVEALASDTLLPDPSDIAISLGERSKWPRAGEAFLERDGVISIEAEEFTSRAARSGVAWDIIPGLGRTGSSVAIFPTTAASVDPTRSPDAAPRLDYRIRVATPHRVKVVMHLVPTHPLQEGNGLRIAVGLDDQPPQILSVDLPVDSPEWAQGVLDAGVTVSAEVDLPSAGDHVLKVYMVDAGVVLDKIVVGEL